MRVDEAVEFFGGKSALARAIGISETALYRWGCEVPKSRRQSVRLAMRAHADELEQKAALMREAAREE